jgi:hypothetical protein
MSAGSRRPNPSSHFADSPLVPARRLFSSSWALPVSVDEVAANATRSPSGGSPASEVRDHLNAGGLDNLNANTLSCGIFVGLRVELGSVR